MGIFQAVSAQLTEAMRARDKARLSALRGIRAAFLNATKEDGSEELSDESCVALLRRLERQRRESIDAFEAGGRSELADAERAELEIIQSFLPSLADQTTTRQWIDQAITETGASGSREVGRVMGALMKAHKGEVDGALARKLAAALLAD